MPLGGHIGHRFGVSRCTITVTAARRWLKFVPTSERIKTWNPLREIVNCGRPPDYAANPIVDITAPFGHDLQIKVIKFDAVQLAPTSHLSLPGELHTRQIARILLEHEDFEEPERAKILSTEPLAGTGHGHWIDNLITNSNHGAKLLRRHQTSDTLSINQSESFSLCVER